MTIAASVVPPTMNGLRSASRSDARPTTISTARSNTQNADMIADASAVLTRKLSTSIVGPYIARDR